LRIKKQIISLELQRLHDFELLKSRGAGLVVLRFAIMIGLGSGAAKGSHHHAAGWRAPQM
jgi:hypothetical protein